LKILIDTGSNNNYILPRFVKSAEENKSPLNVISVGGNIRITHHKTANLFYDPNTTIKIFCCITYT